MNEIIEKLRFMQNKANESYEDAIEFVKAYFTAEAEMARYREIAKQFLRDVNGGIIGVEEIPTKKGGK